MGRLRKGEGKRIVKVGSVGSEGGMVVNKLGRISTMAWTVKKKKKKKKPTAWTGSRRFKSLTFWLSKAQSRHQI